MHTHFEPSYLELSRSGELEERARIANQRLTECSLCPRDCGVDRTAGEYGICQTGAQAIVASVQAHFGEERPLVGRGGSGAIFFSHCNLKCVFCQNYDISHTGHGQMVEARQLAAMMLHVQDAGCHNVNLVSPSHVVPQILSALIIAIAGGLRVPLVYNTGGYDAIETLHLLDGVVDIYMPDVKYADPDAGRRFSGVDDYPSRNQEAVQEMHRQVGDLQVDERGVAERGLLVRHLVLPDGLAGTRQVVRFLARDISMNTYLNVMDQYYPCHRAGEFPELTRRLTAGEYREAIQMAEEAGLTRLDHRTNRLHIF